eukprot:352331-Chlamydomonas_euryale.AAC.7
MSTNCPIFTRGVDSVDRRKRHEKVVVDHLPSWPASTLANAAPIGTAGNDRSSRSGMYRRAISCCTRHLA